MNFLEVLYEVTTILRNNETEVAAKKCGLICELSGFCAHWMQDRHLLLNP